MSSCRREQIDLNTLLQRLVGLDGARSAKFANSTAARALRGASALVWKQT